MSQESHIHGSHNIVIQGVSDSVLTLNINGQVQEIRNDLAELKALLKTRQAEKFQYADKIYNIGHIDEANFGSVTSRIVFNGILVRRLIETWEQTAEVQDFLRKLPAQAADKWEEVPEFLRDAQVLVGQRFVWVLGWELRRLFAIARERNKRQEEKADEYIHHCFSAAKIALQLANFLLVAELWDKKKERNLQELELKLNTAQLELFFGTRPLTMTEHYQLLAHLVDMFAENDLQLPFEKPDLHADSMLAKAVVRLDGLRSLNTVYGLAQCHTAEACLADLLIGLPFFSTNHLVTIKRVEYLDFRSSPPRYVKDFTILEKREAREWQRFLKFDHAPVQSYALLFRNHQRALNLFPFLLDYHALINEQVFQIRVYECREGWRGLRYYNVEQEREQNIYYSGANAEVMEVQTDDQMRALERDIRCDLAIRQLEDAMNTLLGSGHRFVKEASSSNEFENI